MAGTDLVLRNLAQPHGVAKSIGLSFDNFRNQTNGWRAEQLEQRNFVFATDTSKTSAGLTSNTNGEGDAQELDNTTVTPKLTQIRDNLHANYMAALFSNENWFIWKASKDEPKRLAKRDAILAYMRNKTQQSGFRSTVSSLLYDYIDYGNVIASVEYSNETYQDEEGNTFTGYIGPKVVRTSPMDIVFNPIAVDFKSSPKITRKVLTLGEFKKFTESHPGVYDDSAIEDVMRNRVKGRTFSSDDFEKAEAISIDGFGNLYEYYQSDTIELLEFEGDLWDSDTQVLHKNTLITIADRTVVLANKPNPAWRPHGTKVHASWRERPDNLYGMGPLSNLVGMQYRIDKLENAKSDAVDQQIRPPIKIVGEVSDFTWGPGEEIYVGEDGDVVPLRPDLTALQINIEIERIMAMMEEFAGAPKEAMGIRTAGEKTAFEVQQLANAAGRIFQEKINHFEIQIIEPILNAMLEVARRELDGIDIIATLDDDIAVEEFMQLSRADITAEGHLIPMGSRHFAAQQQLIQNLTGLANTRIWDVVQPHLSSKKLSGLVEEILLLKRFDIFEDNVGIEEAVEQQEIASTLQEEGEVAGTLPPQAVEGVQENGSANQ
jgi:hypothetical protein